MFQSKTNVPRLSRFIKFPKLNSNWCMGLKSYRFANVIQSTDLQSFELKILLVYYMFRVFLPNTFVP